MFIHTVFGESLCDVQGTTFKWLVLVTAMKGL